MEEKKTDPIKTKDYTVTVKMESDNTSLDHLNGLDESELASAIVLAFKEAEMKKAARSEIASALRGKPSFRTAGNLFHSIAEWIEDPSKSNEMKIISQVNALRS